MKNIQRIKKYFTFTIISGVGIFIYEVYRTYKTLDKRVDVGVFQQLEPRNASTGNYNKYISIDKTYNSSSFIDRFWDSITYSYAKRLLNVAKCDNKKHRLRAVRDLAQIKNLDDWHYSLLAHMCDAKTAVGLARTQNVNLKFFLNPPNRFVNYNHDQIVKWMKHFLISLVKKSEHACLSYFISKVFVNAQDVGRMVEHDISSAELKQCIKSADDILPICIQSILHHSTIGHHSRDIVQLNGLPLLMELHKRFIDNTDVTIAIVKILSNISFNFESLQEIYRSGWIGALGKLLKHNDIRIHGPAARVLANLDLDDNDDGKYERKVYLLYPTFRNEQKRDVDIVLAHGLLGGVFFTWRQRDKNIGNINLIGKKKPYESITTEEPLPSIVNTSDPLTREVIKEIEERKRLEWDEIGKDFEVIFYDCPKEIVDDGPYSCSGEEICTITDCAYTQCWPKDWIPKDCPNIRVVGINYDTNLSLWAPACPAEKLKCTLDERSDEFLEKLIAAGLGKKPIIWLAHSMGGLLVKNILVKAAEANNENMKNLLKNSKGIIFFSTPHKGSHVASINQTTSLFLWPSVEVRELKEGSPALLKLHNKFLDIINKTNMRVLSFVETECTTISPLKFSFQFVPLQSAKLDIGEYYEIPLDHLRICKPINRHSFLYQKVVNFIKEITNETNENIKTRRKSENAKTCHDFQQTETSSNKKEETPCS